MTANAQHLSHLFAEERRLQAMLRKVERQIKDERVTFCDAMGVTILRREALELAVEAELARVAVEPTPLEQFLDTGRAFS